LSIVKVVVISSVPLPSDGALRAVCVGYRGSCVASVSELIAMQPVPFESGSIVEIGRLAALRGPSPRRLRSGARHDAANPVRTGKSAVTCIPCRDRSSHRDDHYADPDDRIAGTALPMSAALAFACPHDVTKMPEVE
jgi:hypothetical protein